MDPLSDILSLLNVRSVLSARLVTGGDWCIAFPPDRGIRFGVVLEGSCQLKLNDMGPALSLRAGDCYLLSDGRPYLMGSDVALAAVARDEVYAGVAQRVVRYGDGDGDGGHGDVQIVGGLFSVESMDAALLLDSLPPLVCMRAGSDQADVLRWVTTRLAAEQLLDTPGANAMAANLAQIMLVQVLRAYLASEPALPPGWLAGSADPRTGAALRHIHAAPERSWTLEELARSAAMSRSAFALRFKRLVGASPMDYVLRWRVRLAARALAGGDMPVSQVGRRYGYTSESAFSNVFKRTMGVSPRQYRRQYRKAPAAD